jgi:hypothetical protein
MEHDIEENKTQRESFMRSRGLAVVLCLSLPAIALAADIGGFVKDPANRPAAGASLSVSCPGTETKNTRANVYGRYRLSGLPNLKWCTIQVTYGGKTSNAVRINSGSGSKDINLRLRPEGSGWQLVL